MGVNTRNNRGRYLDEFITQHPRIGRMVLEDGRYINMADVIDRLDQGMSTFNEVITVEPQNQIDIKSTVPLSDLNDIQTITSGSIIQEDGVIKLQADASGDADVWIRTVDRGRYSSGLDALAGFGISRPSAPTGNQVIEWGATDFINGYVVGEDADGFFTGVYRDGTLQPDSIHRREDWMDPLTGIFDPKELNIYRISERWYGRGPYKLSIATESHSGEGRVSRADATGLYDNEPITYDPDQPLSVRIRNNGTASAIEVHIGSRQFSIFGEKDDEPRDTSEFRLSQSVGTTFVPLIAFRQKSSGLFGSISHILQSVNLITSSANIVWEIRAFSTISDGSWVTPPVRTNSGAETALEVNKNGTSISGGIQLYMGLQAAGQGSTASGSPLQLPKKELPGNGNEIALCARAVSGTATVTSVFTIGGRW